MTATGLTLLLAGSLSAQGPVEPGDAAQPAELRVDDTAGPGSDGNDVSSRASR